MWVLLFLKKIQINHFKLRYISYTKNSPFEHCILVIAHLYIVQPSSQSDPEEFIFYLPTETHSVP